MKNSLEAYFPLGFRWFGGIMIIIAILSLLQGSWLLPGLLVLGGLVLILTKRGIHLDQPAGRYQSFLSFFGLIWGKWESLPPLDKVIITESTYSQVISSRVSSRELRKREYRTVLRQGKDFKLVIDITNSFDAALITARKVAGIADIPMLDCTKRPPVWID